MNDNDSLFLTVLDVVVLYKLTVVHDVACISAKGIDSGQYIHQRGFSSTILTAKSVYLTAFYFQIDIVQCLYARELFCDMVHFQNVIRHFLNSFLYFCIAKIMRAAAICHRPIIFVI